MSEMHISSTWISHKYSILGDLNSVVPTQSKKVRHEASASTECMQDVAPLVFLSRGDSGDVDVDLQRITCQVGTIVPCATLEQKMMSTPTEHTNTASTAAPSVAGASGGERTQHGNFFGMFFLPSSQLYDDDDVHLSASTSSTYSPIKAAASAASNMIGGILSVIDTALAAMNEEMENSSGSISSDNTKESEVNIDTALLTGSACTCATNMRRGIVMQCCQGAHCKKLSIEVGDMKQCSTDKEEICIDTSEQSCGSGE